MKLSDCYFVYGGAAHRFKVSSDKPTRTRLHNVVQDAIGGGMMEVYQIEPDADARWVVVSEYNSSYSKDAKQSFYVRLNGDMVETKEPAALVFLREQVKARARGRAA